MSALYATDSLSFVRTMCAARQKLGAAPMARVVAPSHFRPRQFEYHPRKPEELVLGSVSGEVMVMNHQTGSVLGSAVAPGPAHSILGLCWLLSDTSLLISGADNGLIQLFDVSLMRQGKPASIYQYEPFEHLTSVHINCLDDSFLASGYSNDVALYDLKSGKKMQTLKALHTQHINVLKFANHSPALFATSSFDGDVKMWDLREGARRPIFTRRSDRGNVMVCFSPDDRYLLSSAVDNEVRQYLAVDGRQVPLLPPASSSASCFLFCLLLPLPLLSCFLFLLSPPSRSLCSPPRLLLALVLLRLLALLCLVFCPCPPLSCWRQTPVAIYPSGDVP